MRADVVAPLEDCVEDAGPRSQLYGLHRQPMEKFVYGRDVPPYRGHAAVDGGVLPWIRPDDRLEPHWGAGCATRLFRAGAFSALAEKGSNADSNGLGQEARVVRRLPGE